MATYALFIKLVAVGNCIRKLKTSQYCYNSISYIMHIQKMYAVVMR